MDGQYSKKCRYKSPYTVLFCTNIIWTKDCLCHNPIINGLDNVFSEASVDTRMLRWHFCLLRNCPKIRNPRWKGAEVSSKFRFKVQVEIALYRYENYKYLELCHTPSMTQIVVTTTSVTHRIKERITKRELRSFLGRQKAFQRFIPNMLQITASLKKELQEKLPGRSRN